MKILSCIDEIYQCGKQEDGTYTRMAYSKEDAEGRDVFLKYFSDLDVTSRVDAAGNLIIRMEGSEPGLPAILVGSHLDTVPDGGRYDGVVGCVAGLGVCDAISKSGMKLRHPIEVIVFTDEEGFRFASGLIGSGAICGNEVDIPKERKDFLGNEFRDVIKIYDMEYDNILDAKKGKEEVHCFFELHVEQGASLHKNNIPIGIVSTIAGVSRYEITVTGESNHSGSTVMADRKDAFVGSAKLIGKVPEIVEAYGNEYSVATVGTISVTPNSVNVIPGEAFFNLEIRDQDEGTIQKIEMEIEHLLKDICEQDGLRYSLERISYHQPEPMSQWLKDAIENVAKELEYPYRIVPSGAFHDALVMTSKFPTAMIFVPSVNGKSHSREELTYDEDIIKGCEVLLRSIIEVDKK